MENMKTIPGTDPDEYIRLYRTSLLYFPVATKGQMFYTKVTMKGHLYRAAERCGRCGMRNGGKAL